MARISVLADDVSLSNPSLVEGFPGIGLVGKIAADHLVEEFEMTHYGNVHCDSLPKVAVYQENDTALQPPVRLYADEERDLLVLQSDVPVQPKAASELADCLAGWFDDNAVTPIYLSGIPTEKSDDAPSLYGLGVAGGVDLVALAGGDVDDRLRRSSDRLLGPELDPVRLARLREQFVGVGLGLLEPLLAAAGDADAGAVAGLDGVDDVQ